MAEYIEREKLIKSIQNKKMVDIVTNCNEPKIRDALFKQGQAIKKIIENQPVADVVKVVRCKDCKYCQTLNHDLTTSYFCEVLKRPAVVEPTDFCSYGELKECEGK